MEFTQKKFLVAGTGISGIGATKLLLKKGADVVLYDGNESLDQEKVLDQFEERNKITFVLGSLKKEHLNGVEAMVISPGIPYDAPFTEIVREEKIPIWSEIELAWQAGQGRVLAITGTNGKTTTTALVGKIMEDYYKSTFVVGNIVLLFYFCTASSIMEMINSPILLLQNRYDISVDVIMRPVLPLRFHRSP